MKARAINKFNGAIQRNSRIYSLLSLRRHPLSKREAGFLSSLQAIVNFLLFLGAFYGLYLRIYNYFTYFITIYITVSLDIFYYEGLLILLVKYVAKPHILVIKVDTA